MSLLRHIGVKLGIVRFKHTPQQARKLWVAALRSGEFTQGIDWLCRNGNYCCLGVACELFCRHEYQLSVSDEPKRYDMQYKTLPQVVADWLGLKDCFGSYGVNHSLTYCNDGYLMTFEKIADLIENEPEGLFV